MAYTMRYQAELRDPAEYFSGIKEHSIDKDQLALAKELIKRSTAKFVPSKFEDDYEVALRELIDAKIEHHPLPQEEKAPKRAKVINLMDALRKSVNAPPSSSRSDRPSASKHATAEKKSKSKSSGLKLVKPHARRKKTA